MQKKNLIILSISAVALLIGTAAAATYVTQKNMSTETIAVKKPAQTSQALPWRNTPNAPQQQPAQQTAQALPPCDDGNIVGVIVGGAAGGLLGNQVGKGSGNTAATIGGTLGGAYLGGQHLPTRNVTCR